MLPASRHKGRLPGSLPKNDLVVRTLKGIEGNGIAKETGREEEKKK